MELVFVALRGRASFEVAHVAALVGNDKRPLKLSGSTFVDAEVRAQLHRALDALGDVAKRPVGEDRRVQSRIIVVADRNHRTDVLLDQFRVLLHGLAHAAEDDSELGEFVLEGSSHADAVHHEIHRHAAQALLLLERNAQLVHRLAQLRVHLVEGGELLLLLGGRVVADGLEIRLLVLEMGPLGLHHRFPRFERLEAPLKEPLRFVLLGADQPNDVFVKSRGSLVRVNVRREPKLVGLPCDLFQNLVFSVVRHVCILSE